MGAGWFREKIKKKNQFGKQVVSNLDPKKKSILKKSRVNSKLLSYESSPKFVQSYSLEENIASVHVTE